MHERECQETLLYQKRRFNEDIEIQKKGISFYESNFLKSNDNFQIFVKNFIGKTLVLDVSSNYLVLQLLEILNTKTKVPNHEISLVYQGKNLEEHKSLNRYHIENNSTVYMMIRLKGGMQRKQDVLKSIKEYNDVRMDEIGSTMDKLKQKTTNKGIKKPIKSMPFTPDQYYTPTKMSTVQTPKRSYLPNISNDKSFHSRNASGDMRTKEKRIESTLRSEETPLYVDVSSLIFQMDELRNENNILNMVNKEAKENYNRELSQKDAEVMELKKVIRDLNYLSEKNKLSCVENDEEDENYIKDYEEKLKILLQENKELKEKNKPSNKKGNEKKETKKKESLLIPKKQPHPIYKQCSPDEADACAWVFSSPDVMEKYYYKLPKLGDLEVRGRVIYSSLCHTDAMTVRGKWGKWAPCHYPLCAGHEVICEVIMIGSKVTKIKVGEIVGWGYLRDSCGKCEWCKKGFNNYCQKMEPDNFVSFGYYFGGFSTHVQQPERYAIKIPSTINLEIAAPLLCAGITGFTPLLTYGKKGMKVAIIGIGGIGHLAVQFAYEMGLEVDAFNVNPGLDEIFEKLGITKSINWRTEKLSAYRNTYDLIINTMPTGIEASEMDDFLWTLKPTGKFINIALADVSEPVSFCQFSLVSKGLSIEGTLVGGLYHYEKMFEFLATHKVESLCEYYEWDEFPTAFEKMENGIPIFKCVINVNKESMKYMDEENN